MDNINDIQAISPRPLKKGDCIGVFAPSSYVEKDDIEKSKSLIESFGYKVFVHPQTYERLNQSAGNNLQKALAFQGLWQRKDIHAIWAAGGGNRCLSLIDSINFNKLKEFPKPLVGFSDVTALLNAVYAHTGIRTFHGPVFKNLHKTHKEDLRILLNFLGGVNDTTLPLTSDNVLREGTACGKLIGGNLSVFQYLPETLPKNFYHDAILFLEDCNEEISKIDRMLLHLKRTGVFSKINGLAIGNISLANESGRPFGFTLENIIQEHLDGCEIPILIDLPFGHEKRLYPLPIGAQAEINTKNNTFNIKE